MEVYSWVLWENPGTQSWWMFQPVMRFLECLELQKQQRFPACLKTYDQGNLRWAVQSFRVWFLNGIIYAHQLRISIFFAGYLRLALVRLSINGGNPIAGLFTMGNPKSNGCF